MRTPAPWVRAPHGCRMAFSLIELLVVMSVAILLTALMMPAMQQLRENAQRVVCMSNMQQLGLAFTLYGGDHDDELPESAALKERSRPQDLMLARTGIADAYSSRPVGADGSPSQWDGLGHFYELHYCDASECFYCPSHHGRHLYERYAEKWDDVENVEPIYTNYHYAGNLQWNDFGRRRLLTEGYKLVLLTDGLRTAEDFNHVLGMNTLRGDGSVHWCDDTSNILNVLPRGEGEPISSEYFKLWDMVQQAK